MFVESRWRGLFSAVELGPLAVIEPTRNSNEFLEIFYSQMRPYDSPKWGPETGHWFQEQQWICTRMAQNEVRCCSGLLTPKRFIKKWDKNHLTMSSNEVMEKRNILLVKGLWYIKPEFSESLPTPLWLFYLLCRVLSGAVPVVEIFPGDESVIRSNGVLNSYFTHHKPRLQEQEVKFSLSS